jgi:rhodanese-related sulfurtransferase
VTPPEQPPFEIGPRDLAELRAGIAPYAILDVREPWDVALASFPEAIHVPLAALTGSETSLPRDRILVVVCHHGQRSWLATRHRRGQGFTRATNLCGGIDAWSTVAPTVPRY